MKTMALGLLCSLLIGAGWFAVVLRLDTHRRDKNSRAILLKFFLAGFLSLIPTFLLYRLSYAFWGNFLDYGWLFAFIDELFITGPVEEFAKFITFLLLSRRMKSIKEPLDGVLQGAAVALAFATAENFLYSVGYGPSVLPLRAVLSTTGHLVYASFWGYIYAAVVYESAGRRLVSEYKAIFAAVLPAAILHGLYNFMLDLGLPTLAVLIDLAALVAAGAIYRYLHRLSPYRPLSREKPRQALVELNAALRYNPESQLLNQRLALLCLYYRDYSKALKHVGICRKRRPRNPYFLCVEAVVRILSGEIDRGAGLMEEAWPRLTLGNRKVLYENVRRVVSKGSPPIIVPTALGSQYPLTSRFFGRLAGSGDPAFAGAWRRVQLSQRRYLARVG